VQVRLRDTAASEWTIAVSPALPPGSRVTAVRAHGRAVQPAVQETAHDVHASIELPLRDSVTLEFEYAGGAEVATPEESIEVGQPSMALRVLDFRQSGSGYSATLEGLPGREYELVIHSRAELVAVQGADRVERRGSMHHLRVLIPGGGPAYRRHEVRFGLRR
jgi:hypothetical protein